MAYDETTEKRTVWQFKHGSFRKDAPEKLCDISRRASRPNNQQQTSLSPSPPPPLPPSSSSSSSSSRFPSSLQSDEITSDTLNIHKNVSGDGKRSARSSVHDVNDSQSLIHTQIDSLHQKISQLDRKCQELNNEAIQLRTLQISQQNVSPCKKRIKTQYSFVSLLVNNFAGALCAIYDKQRFEINLFRF